MRRKHFLAMPGLIASLVLTIAAPATGENISPHKAEEKRRLPTPKKAQQ